MAKKGMVVTNKDVSELLRSVAAAYLIKKESRFRIVAYEKAADAIEQSSREAYTLWQEHKLDEIPGIGTSIASYLDEYFKTGDVKHFKAVFKGIPEPTFALMNVPSIGPMRAYKLTTTFQLHNPKTVFNDLRKLAEKGEIAKLETFGEKSQQLILDSLDQYERLKQMPSRMPLPYAFEIAKDIIQYLKINPHIKRIDTLGSLRRMVTTIGDVDIAVAADDKHAAEILKHFLAYPKKSSIDNAGEKKASIIVPPRVRVDFRIQSEKSYGSMLQYFTGSKQHNINLREYALKQNLSLNEYGMKQLSKPKAQLLEFSSEETFYGHLGLDYIPPEIREGSDEIELAKQHKLPHLVELKDIKGDLHLHSNYDLKPSHDMGVNSYKEICKRGQELGYEYVGFSDHNPKLSGHTKGEIISIMEKRKAHIDATLKSFNTKTFSYFIGLETDILPSGELALPEAAIDQNVDFLIISLHSSFTLDRKEQTKRVKTALLYPKVKIFGHPTGRLLGKREGADLDWEEIFDVCLKKNIAIEINSWPERLDLPDTLVRSALKKGLKFVIDTDAHANSQMDNMFYGVSVARRGWAEKKDILNTYSLSDFKTWLES